MKVIAHRGSNRKALENSSHAFDVAIAEKADRIECDLQISKDQQIFVFHDNGLTTSKGDFTCFDQLSYSDIKTFFQRRHKSDLLTIEEVLEKYLPAIELNLEIKPAHQRIATELSKILKTNSHRDKIILSSFQEPPLLVFRDLVPDIARACLIDASTLKQWPLTFSNYAPQVFMEKVSTNIIHPYFKMLNDEFMEQAELKGWQVYTWARMTDESADIADTQWTELCSYDISGHCTNLPAEFRQFITKQDTLKADLLKKIRNMQRRSLKLDLNL